MLGRLNHVALAVPDLAAASAKYQGTLGATVSAPQALPEHGVSVVFVDVGNTKIELLEPLGEGSPIAAFLEKNPSGGMHHLCYEVDDLDAEIARFRRRRCLPLTPPAPAVAFGGRRIVFLMTPQRDLIELLESGVPRST